MKKKLFVFLLSLISVVCLAVGLTACGSEGSETQTVSVASVTLDKSSLDLTIGESYTLSATILPSNATNTSVTWSSSATSIATVSGGKVTAISEGTAVITVTTTDGGYTDTCTVTVTETQETPSTVSVTSVSLSETSLSLEAGGTYTLTATVLPSNATDKTVSWSSSDESVAIVNNGVITAVAAGTATITVTTTDGNYTATCELTITEEPEEPATVAVTSVTLDKSTLALTVGDEYTLTATISPNNATNKNITWSTSDNTVTTVTNGTVTAVSAGTATITVTTEDGNFTDTCAVTVEENTPSVVAVTDITLDKTTLTLTVGDEYTLTATISPNDATNKNVTWTSSDNTVATVSNGVVTAVSAGTATITVTTVDGSYTDTCTVTVENKQEEPATVAVTGVTLDKTTLTLTVGDEYTLTATISPSDATNKNVSWSSLNESVVIVEGGKLTAVSEGTAVIIVTTADGGKLATCTVTVQEATISVTSVTLNKTTLTLEKDDTFTLTATILPSDATNQAITWSSSDSSIVSVSDGEITAIGAGTATITVTTADGNYTATCEVTVIISVTSIELSETSLTLEKGKTATLTATITPSGATNQAVTWVSSDESVITVDNGTITAVGTGTATITVITADGNYTATCEVTVIISVTAVELSKTTLTLEKGDTATLTATITPSGATNQAVTWNSSDESVITVDNGTITAVGTGTATITVITADGNYTANCEVTVMISVTSIAISSTTLNLEKGDTSTLTATITPSNATNQTVTWSSSDESVATVSNGVITAVGTGTATITVTTADGNYTATCEVMVIISVTSVIISSTTLNLEKGDTATLTATITPSAATNQAVTWSSSDESVITIDNGAITAVGIGTATITVTTDDGNYTATCEITVTSIKTAVTDIEGGTINGTSIYMLVDSTTKTLSLSSSVTCSDNCGWKLYDESDGKNAIETKITNSLADGYNTYYIVVTSTKDATVSATYTLTIYKSFAVTVSYYNGDSVINTVTAYTGYEYSANYTPDITGYTFNYWKTSDNQTYSAAIIYADLSLYADTTVNTYTVTYDANGGSVNETQINVTYDSSYTFEVPARDGYTFNGWYYGEKQLTNESGESLSIWNYAENTTVTAKWTANKYSITLVLSDSNAGTVTGGGTYAYDSTVTISATTNSGYTWSGWYNSEGEFYSDLSYTFTMGFDATYTATWTANNYTVTLDLSDSEAGTVKGDGSHTYNTSVTITAETNTGYTWLGWYDSNGTQVAPDASYTFTMGFNVTYTAKWTYYTVTTAVNDAEAGTVTTYSDTKVTVGNSVEITATTNDGYTWLGWYDESGNQLTAELTYSFSMDAKSVICTAKWTYYTVTTATDNEDAGSISSYTDTKVAVGDKVTITATINDGYTFLGWYKAETFATNNLSYSFTMAAESVTYTAKWMVCPVTLEKNIDEAGEVDGISKTIIGDEVTITATTNDGYTFIGWYNGDSPLASALSYTFTMSTESVTYTAKWMDNTITISSDNTSGGEVSGLTNSNNILGNTITITADEANLGYTFLGWYSGNTLLTTDYSYSATITETATDYVAKYEVNSEMANFEFTSTTETCEITGIIDNTVTEIVVPDYVTDIASGAFSGCGSLVSITLPFIGGNNSATKASASTELGYIFGTAEYSGGTAITQYYKTYYIPSTLTTVILTGGSVIYNGFYNLSTITSITIPATVTEIKTSAFNNCTSLSAVYITDLAAWCSITFESAEANPLYYAGNLYLNGERITELVIPDSVITINDYAFYKCSITSVTIGENVISIGNYAFYNCSLLKSLSISSGSIGNYAFYSCYKLESVNMGNGVINIGNYAFSNCTALTIVSIPDSATSIGRCAFSGCNALTSVDIGNGVKSIGDSAFNWCNKLTSLTIGNNVTSIEIGAFYYCRMLTSIIIPDSVTSIGGRAFYHCDGLVSITIGSGVISIDGGAFEECTSLTNIYISDLEAWCNISFTYEEDNPLYYAGRLYLNGELVTDLVIPDSVTTINSYAFYNCITLEKVTISDSVISIGSYAFNGCTSLVSVTIGENVTSIGDGAFSGCTTLESIAISDSVTYIGKDSFSWCTSLINITIPESVTFIGSGAFYRCTSLINIIVNDENMNYKSIDGNLYTYDGTELIQYALGKTDNTFVIPNTVTSICTYAFEGCAVLTNIVISESITLINEYAFYNCTSLSNIYYLSTESEWNSISISTYGNTYFTAATVYYYSEETPTESGNYWHYDANGEIKIWS